jgi:hypothetical protein
MLKTLFGVATFPAVLAHELTHYVVGAPVAARQTVGVRVRDGRAAVRVDWRPDAPQWAIAAAALAPAIAGCVALVAALTAWTLAGSPTPASVSEWATLALVAGWWAVYATPSAGDIETARGGGRDA